MNSSVVYEGYDPAAPVLVIGAYGDEGAIHELLEDIGILGAIQHLDRDDFLLSHCSCKAQTVALLCRL